MTEREVGVETIKKVVNMGADNYSSASSRLITLQNRKQLLEESIAQKNQELRELCIQEAQLTSIMPPEVPLEPGETLPNFRRKVGTAFEYPPNLISKLNEKESIAALEAEIQFQRCILEDATRLVSDAGNVKEKRKNALICEQAKHTIKDMEDKIEYLKQQRYGAQTMSSNQLKQKKKPRPPFKFDVKNNNFGSHGEEINKSYLMHNYAHQTDGNHLEVENERYMTNRIVTQHNYIDGNHIITNYNRQDYNISYTLDRVPPNIYNNQKDRRSSSCSSNNSYTPQNTYPNSHPVVFQQQYSHTLPLNTHMPIVNPQIHYQNHGISQPNLNYQISPHNVHTSPLRPKTLDNDPRKSISESHSNGYIQETYVYPSQYVMSAPHDKIYESDHYSNAPLYHHAETEILSTGLGGYWLKNENNDSIWVPTVSPLNTPVHWPRDKRFGSLDRRKDKYVHNKHVSAVENRKITQEPIHVATLPHPQTVIRSPSSHDCKPLVRTQSLGSVGAQTVDISWPDDNSSCDSDGQSLKDRNMYSRRSKPKGWCETSLDSPPVHSENIINSNLLEEPLYTPPSRISYSQTPKLLEIPAESNPSPIHPDANNELFNNNGLMDLPKNCTVVQAGQFKPYREVTKPFEMEDFYKYSTKFREKKASVEQRKETDVFDAGREDLKGKGMREYENQEGDSPGMVQKSIYQPLQPMKCQPFGPPK